MSKTTQLMLLVSRGYISKTFICTAKLS